MRVNPMLAPALFVVVLIGSVLTAQLTGIWSISGRTTIDPTNQITASDIKGWMTLQQVIDGIPVPKEELYTLLQIPVDIPATTALKDLESLVPGFETSAVRDALTKRAEGTQAETVTPPPPTPMPTPEVSVTPLPASQIKGKMTLQEISTQCMVPLDALIRGLKLPPETDANSQIKTLIDQGLLTEVAEVQTLVTTLQGK